MRRAADTAPQHSRKTTGHRDAAGFVRPLVEGGETMRDVVVAGGLRGFTVDEMFGGAA